MSVLVHPAPAPAPAFAPPTGVAPGGPGDDRPRPLRRRSLDDHLSLAGAALASLAFTWLLYFQILPLSGPVGFSIAWYVAFLAFYAAVTWQSHPWTAVKDRVMSAVITAGAVVVGGGLAWTVITTFWNGFDAFRHANFFTSSMAGVRTNAPFTQGGILHALIGSGIEIGIAVAIALPLGVGAGIYMSEIGGRFATIVRTVVEAMTALPDLVAGLFIYTTLVVGLRLGRTGLAAALAIAITMLPIIARSSEVVLRVVPGGLREAGSALGASQWQTVWRVVLPTARPGLATALILGVARGIGETAPVLIVSGLSTFTNADPLHNPMSSLPLFAYFAVRSPGQAYITRGYAAASVLLALVLMLFIVVRIVARHRKPTTR